MGWNTRAEFPRGLKKCIIIVGPHTSWVDLIIGLGFRSVMRLRNARFLGKKELFDGPFGFFFRWLGGVPVDRFSQQNVVDQVVELIHREDEIMIALSPEGTRKKVERLRTGFYHIAKQAGIPIVMSGLDFANKKLVLSEPFVPGDDIASDFDRILSFYDPIRGCRPEKDMAGLKNQFREHA